MAVDGRLEPRAPTARVWGSGTVGTPAGPINAVSCHDEGPTTVVHSEQLELVVVRMVGAEARGEHALTGSWGDGGTAVLATVRLLMGLDVDWTSARWPKVFFKWRGGFEPASQHQGQDEVSEAAKM